MLRTCEVHTRTNQMFRLEDMKNSFQTKLSEMQSSYSVESTQRISVTSSQKLGE